MESAEDLIMAAIPLGVSNREDRLAQEVGALRGSLRSVCWAYSGQNQLPRKGCRFLDTSLGDADIRVEYEFDPGQADRPNADLPNPGPGYPCSAVILQALVNGTWVDAECFAEAEVERWVQEAINQECEE
jgi:hypothetical protein